MTHRRHLAVAAVAMTLLGEGAWAQTQIQPMQLNRRVTVVPVLQVELPPDVLVWSAARPLTWEDFRGSSPRRLDGARSSLGYGYALTCQQGRLLSRIVAYFVPAQSWVTHRIASSGLASRVGIVHEQTHFDLKEVFARRVRKRLAELTDPCSRTDAQLHQIVEAVLKDERDEQTRYDTRTGNGENLDQQDEWNRKIAAELTALKDFVDKA